MPDSYQTLAEAPSDGGATETAHKAFRLAARLRSFGFALNGIRLLVREEHNAWLHLAASIAVIAIGLALRLDLSDWRWIILAMALVWTAEALNTALEQLCNRVGSNLPAHKVAGIREAITARTLRSFTCRPTARA